MKDRKIAANYIFLPGYPLIRNGYVILTPSQVTAVDTGGQLREIAGLEFYGGMIVPEYVLDYQSDFLPEKEMLPLLKQCFAERGNMYTKVAIIEGADLKTLTWRRTARVRLL